MINGIEIAGKILAKLKKQPAPQKELAAILVGSDAASLSYLKQKQKAGQQVGVNFRLYQLPESSQREVENKIRELSLAGEVGGIIVQLPLPAQYDRLAVLNQIVSEKDVDNLTGRAAILPPAVGTLEIILKELNFDLKSATAAVVGAGILIGTPIARWLKPRVKNLQIMKKGNFLPENLKEADLIVSGTGVPNLIKGEYIKKGAVVIDFGYGKIDDKFVGDIETVSVQKKTEQFTPTPGGTGPIVVAMLFRNFFELNNK